MSTAPLDLSNPQRPVHVGVILMDSITEILDVAPIDFLYGISSGADFGLPEEYKPEELGKQAVDFHFHWVSKAGPEKLVQMTAGIKLQPTVGLTETSSFSRLHQKLKANIYPCVQDSFETCPPLDVVLIGAHKFDYVPSEEELEFVRKSYNDCSAFLTICGGVIVPQLAGLLKGRTATTPRPFLAQAREMAPETNWIEKRWVRDGKLWTSNTLLNGTDMMAAFAKEIWGNRAGEGEMSIVDYNAQVGAWPSRDVDFKDVPWKI